VAWAEELSKHGLDSKYPNIADDIIRGFDLGIPTINQTYTPLNHTSVNQFSTAYYEIIGKKFTTGRYLGPFSRSEVEILIGPFQSLPLSLVPKPGKPGKFRAVHNFLHPHSPLSSTASVNSAISADKYPSTYGTFTTICLTISRLPPGSQASVRDVSEAYRTIPVRPDQWPGLVVRLEGNDRFAINTNNNFGLTSAGGVYGRLADAGADIFRANGIGPLSKWVDDHMFFRILRAYLHNYNDSIAGWKSKIQESGGRIHDGSRIWYCGKTMPDGKPEEFDEDCSAMLRDLSENLPCSAADSDYSYSDHDIDEVSARLGIKWEESKTIPFGFLVPYLGFEWNLKDRTVSIPEKKKQKYLTAIEEWESQPTHALLEVQKLHGKLLHATLVVPEGRAYLTNLETMLGTFNDRPFVPHTQPRDTECDLEWWKQLLCLPTISRPIPKPTPIVECCAYSDASSSVGIAITIGDRWRAWRLVPGWKSDGRDIGWAEAVGFELLIRSLSCKVEAGTHLKVYGDNIGVVEGWWKGRSRNRQANVVFRRVHRLASQHDIVVHTRYVASEDNPADGPSRGIYPPLNLLLPPILLPVKIHPYVIDFNHPEVGQ